MARGFKDADDEARVSDLVDLAATVRHETEKAFLIDHDPKPVWVPKSQCEYDAPTKTLTLPRWLAEEKGLV